MKSIVRVKIDKRKCEQFRELGLFSPEGRTLGQGRADCCLQLPQTQVAAKKIPVGCKEENPALVRLEQGHREIV